ncbi:MAG TPA: cytochrome c peroxidase, partial [Flavisolibacter sp.]|nr:cytochrome c peroxidase [Flavisolibacter sp.]
VFIMGGGALLNSCRKSDRPFTRTTPITLPIPQGFPQPVYNFQNNPLTEESFLLGRKLFYDGRLSIDGNFPCASCHQQVAAFTTFEHDRSHGYNHSHTLRNAPGLANLAWYPVYKWDGSATTLESISLAHITAPNEMAETMDNVINKLKNDTAYQRLFRAAYGSEQITSDGILKALTQFVLNLVSANSKYDKVKKGEASFTAEEQSGYAVFQSKCATCHTEPLFTDFSFRNVGLEIDENLQDYGRMRVTGNKADSLKFRVPSLRNVNLTSYYTHDGRYSVMRMMVQHYRFGVNQSATLDPLLTNGISLTDAQENDIIAFLRTLSDSSYINNPRFRE